MAAMLLALHPPTALALCALANSHACQAQSRRSPTPVLEAPDDGEAYKAFRDEVKKSPLLRQYGIARVKAMEELSELPKEYEAGLNFGNQIRARFLAPRIDDIGLPFADVLVCIGGALFIAQWSLSPAIPADIKIPLPSWLAPVAMPPGYNWRGLPFIVPAISHGLQLGVCWVLGALAASAYESEAYSGTLSSCLAKTWRAGSFAIGVLLLSAQVTTSASLSAQGLDPNTVVTTAGIDAGAQADAQILTTTFEVLCDVGVQAIQMTLWRAYRWALARGATPGDDGGRGRRQVRPDYGADEYNPFQVPPREE